ncbi:hypothetical protein [Mycolicibacterium lutetiense]|uniref:NTP pyrophosphohydrolase MazG putative catalytic core domain-containing protein n=1 Tax=Mycolicibacterium lutetiense TaxID=1641992 RepID=A0ABS4ZU13_9MYCO|nr:hypothetical protein [Mycolicibacterium lutetiense]MBP2452666.1 hypothetical protein [Mycolicibacterium lutetiense]
MPSSGDVFIAQDSDGDLWLFEPVFSRRTKATTDDLTLALARHDWDAVDRTFRTWPELEAYRQDIARAFIGGRTSRQFAEYDERDVELVLEESRDIDIDEREETLDLLFAVLRYAEVVRSAPYLFKQVTDRIDELRQRRSTLLADEKTMARMALPAAA